MFVNHLNHFGKLPCIGVPVVRHNQNLMYRAGENVVVSTYNLADSLLNSSIEKSRCPADGVTVREQTKEFVQERCRTDHAFRQKTLHALQESGIDGWRPVHTGRGSFIVPKKETDHADTTV